MSTVPRPSRDGESNNDIHTPWTYRRFFRAANRNFERRNRTDDRDRIVGSRTMGTCALFRKSISGSIIDTGIYVTLFAIALGILTEISYALRAQGRQPT
jgi:hypothetical protein